MGTSVLNVISMINIHSYLINIWTLKFTGTMIWFYLLKRLRVLISICMPLNGLMMRSTESPRATECLQVTQPSSRLRNVIQQYAVSCNLASCQIFRLVLGIGIKNMKTYTPLPGLIKYKKKNRMFNER